MSNHEHAHAKLEEKPKELPLFVIERNGRQKTLSHMALGKKASRPNLKFQAPVITAENFQEDAEWTGIDNLVGMGNKWMRSVFGQLWIDALDEATNKETGIVDQHKFTEKFLADAADFTAGEAKLSDIVDEIEELSILQTDYVENEEWGFGTVNPDGTETDKHQSTVKAMKELSAKITALRQQKNSIKADYAERAAKREAAKAKKAAETTTATAGVVAG